MFNCKLVVIQLNFFSGYLLCNVCVLSAKWKPIVEEPQVWMAMGCHPKSAVDYTEWAEIGLRKSLKHKKTVALGEIGLDYSKQWVLHRVLFVCAKHYLHYADLC